MTADPVAPASTPRWRSSLSTIRAAGVAGLVFALLITVAMLLIHEEPPSDPAGFPDWWAGYAARYALAVYLIPFAGIAFLWFLAVLRRRIGRGEDQLFATVLLGSGLLFVAMLFASGAVASADPAILGTSDVGGYETFVFGRSVARAFFFVFATKMAATFMLIASTIARHTGILPRWFVAAGMVAGIGLLIAIPLFDLSAVIFPIWVALLSIQLLRDRPEEWD
jgi:hypothetical protein